MNIVEQQEKTARAVELVDATNGLIDTAQEFDVGTPEHMAFVCLAQITLNGAKDVLEELDGRRH